MTIATSSQLTLVTGPARSGKSEWAETLAMQSQQSVIYVATAQFDDRDREWQARIAQHIARRPSSWQTRHAPVDLVSVLQTAPPHCCFLIDSLGTWVANLLDTEDGDWDQTLEMLLTALSCTTSTLIFVAEETGWGVVPAYPLGRKFRDRLGTVVRRIGAIADRVYLVTGGYAVDLAQLGVPIDRACGKD
jgi:adenosylcobinamide kinase/adenosylcobinamide-phosphate guanylyltransferase